MKPADKLKKLDMYLYYTIFEYKDRYPNKFHEIFPNTPGVNDLTRDGLIIWIGVVIALQYSEIYDKILPNL